MNGDVSQQLLVQIIQRLDALLIWQQRILEKIGEVSIPLPAEIVTVSDSEKKLDRLMRLLLAEALPSSPARTIEFLINAVTPTIIYSNDATEYQRIEVTNDDPAQPAWIGDRNVSLLTGQVLLAQVTRPYVIPRGAELYAICAVATISMRVAEAYDLVRPVENMM